MTTSPMYRTSDPRTSRLAAESIAPHVSRLQRLVLDLIAASPDGLTDEDLVNGLPLECPGSVVKRRGELRDAGLVEDSGLMALNHRNRWVTIWRMVA